MVLMKKVDNVQEQMSNKSRIGKSKTQFKINTRNQKHHNENEKHFW